MKFRWVLLFSTLFVLAVGSAAAQGDMPTASQTNANPIMIQEVEVGGAKEAVMLTIKGVQTDGCDYPLNATISRETSEDATSIVYVDVKRDETALDTTCSSEAASFELEVELGDFSDVQRAGDNPLLIVNDFAARLIVMVETIAADPQPQLPMIEHLVLYPVVIETVTAPIVEDAASAETVFTLSGAYGTGCEVPTYTRTVVDETTKQIEIRLFQVMSAAQACPAILLYYEDEITLTDELSGTYELFVNGVRFIYEAESGTVYSEGELMRLPTVIETVDVLVMESFPPQLSLQVTGYQSDGCDFPAQVEIRREAETSTVYVQIFREMPLAVMCPANIIPYEASINLGAFDPGTYTIIVNDVETQVEL